MPTQEKQIESYLKGRAEEEGALCLKFTSPGTRGVPDRMILSNGQVFFVELKRPKGGKLSALQKHWRKKFEAQGFYIHVLKNREEVDDFVERNLA